MGALDGSPLPDGPTGQGRIFTSGRNQYGQLGNGLACPSDDTEAIVAGGIVEQHRFEPVKALENEDIWHVAAGESHVLASTSCGKRVFAWGRSDKGQLGLGIEKAVFKGGTNVGDVATPTLVTFFNESQIVLKNVACGGSHSMALTDSDAVYTWGYTDGKDIPATAHGPKEVGLDIYVPTKLDMQVGSNGPRFMCISFAGGPQGSLFLDKKRPEDVPQDENYGPM